MTDPYNPNPRLDERLESLEKSLLAFAKLTRNEMLRKMAQLGLRERIILYKKTEGEERLYKSIRTRLRKRQGDIEGLAWSFARHGIFVERGVGKNRPVGSGAAAFAAQPWLYPVLNTAIENLADLLAEEYADIVAAEVVIRIPGVIDTTIR